MIKFGNCTVCDKGQMIHRYTLTDKDGIRHEHYSCNNCNHKEVIDFDLEDQRFERIRKTEAYKDKCFQTNRDFYNQ